MRRHRAHMRIAVVAMMLVACGGGKTEPTNTASEEPRAGLPPTVDRVTGVWLDTGELFYVLFTEEGRFTADDERGHLYFTPYIEGTYQVEGNTITFTTVHTEICAKGDTSAWTASVPEPGKLQVEVIEAGGQPCGWTLGDHEFLRVGES